MLRSIIFFVISIITIPVSTAKEILTGGTLQAYWAENWNDAGTVNKPHLGLRYLTADKKRFIVLSIKESKIEFINKNFKNIPRDFFKLKEWYITQQGDLTVNAVKEGLLCNSYIYDAKAITFKPNTSADPVDTALYEGTAYGGCNGDGKYPYITVFVGKNENSNMEFKSMPDDNAPTVTKEKYKFIVKIHKINKDWMYAGVYDEKSPSRISPPYGYIRTGSLIIVH